MRIASAQIKLEKGITNLGIDKHVLCITKAIAMKADAIIFPELSLCGYEPTLVKDNLLTKTDDRLTPFLQFSREGNITIILGAPIESDKGVEIGAFIIKPDGDILTYSKQYLHSTESAYFVPGIIDNKIAIGTSDATLAICYESKVEEHVVNSAKHNPTIHLVSLVEDNIAKSKGVLSEYAKKYNLPMIISNCVGESGGYDCDGGSCFIPVTGEVVSSLDAHREGILMVDVDKESAEIIYI